MSRTLPATVSTAITKDATRPAYLVRFSVSTDSPIGETLAATWSSNILWNGETWLASGVEVRNLSRARATVELPLGDTDPWLNLINTQVLRGKQIQIYEHYTDETQSPQAGAVLMFTGLMDSVTLADKATVQVTEISRAIQFPLESVTTDKFTFLLQPGTIIEWSGNTIISR